MADKEPFISHAELRDAIKEAIDNARANVQRDLEGLKRHIDERLDRIEGGEPSTERTSQ